MQLIPFRFYERLLDALWASVEGFGWSFVAMFQALTLLQERVSQRVIRWPIRS
jgi:hypothetical protein